MISGLKEDRRGLEKLIEMARKRQIDAIVVAYKDRLTRFGFTYFKELFEAYSVRVIIAFHEEPKDYYQELVDDLIAIVTSFAGRIYGKRIRKFIPSMTRYAVRGRKKGRVIKVQLRLAKLDNGLVLDRDVIGAINIGLKYISSDGRV